MTAALFVFRKKMPDAPRPYRAFGYPLIPMIFLLVTAALLVNTFVAAPHEALRGIAVLAAGLPFYWYWARY
jgi:APA family basic amino acid/polyamine antiporter